jgi:hypothetical protein
MRATPARFESAAATIAFSAAAAFGAAVFAAATPGEAANSLPPILGPGGLIADHGGQPVPADPAGAAPALPPPNRALDLQVVGEVPPHLFQGMAFGDSDHDGLVEVGMYVNDNGNFPHRIYETAGGHVYNQVEQGPALIPYGIGDSDRDGFGDIMGQWSYWLYVHESSSTTGYPDHQSWQSQAMTNVVGFATYADVDQDGRTEILHTYNPFSGPCYLMVFENDGTDAFNLIYQAFLDNGNAGYKVVEDFDGDGRLEIATSTLNGLVTVFENTGDDAYVQTWTGDIGTLNAYAASLGHDMDGNGKPEFVIGGSSDATGYVTSIYEATGDNSYAPVATITIVNGYHGFPFNATGDVDGLAGDELVVEAAFDMYVYKADGVGNYVEIAHVPQPVNIMNGVVCADGDRDGTDEIYWQTEAALGGPPTLIYERAEVAGIGVTNAATPETEPVLIAAPNPFVGTTILRGSGAEIRIYDLGGRLVRTLGDGGAARVWDGRDARGQRLAPGVYLLLAGTEQAKLTLLPQ